MQRAARHNSFSVHFRSISLCEKQSAEIFRQPRENRTNYGIYKFAASGPIGQKQLKQVKEMTKGMKRTLRALFCAEIVLIKTQEHWRKEMY